MVKTKMIDSIKHWYSNFRYHQASQWDFLRGKFGKTGKSSRICIKIGLECSKCVRWPTSRSQGRWAKNARKSQRGEKKPSSSVEAFQHVSAACVCLPSKKQREILLCLLLPSYSFLRIIGLTSIVCLLYFLLSHRLRLKPNVTRFQFSSSF